MDTAHTDSQQEQPTIWMASVGAGVGIIWVSAVVGLLFFGDIDPETHQGYLLPAIVFGLAVMFSITYPRFNRNISRLQAMRTEVLSDPELDSAEHREEAAELLSKLPDGHPDKPAENQLHNAVGD